MPTPIPFTDASVTSPLSPESSEGQMPEAPQAAQTKEVPGWLGQALSLWQRQPQASDISPDIPLTGH